MVRGLAVFLHMPFLLCFYLIPTYQSPIGPYIQNRPIRYLGHMGMGLTWHIDEVMLRANNSRTRTKWAGVRRFYHCAQVPCAWPVLDALLAHLPCLDSAVQ